MNRSIKNETKKTEIETIDALFKTIDLNQRKKKKSSCKRKKRGEYLIGKDACPVSLRMCFAVTTWFLFYRSGMKENRGWR